MTRRPSASVLDLLDPAAEDGLGRGSDDHMVAAVVAQLAAVVEE